MRENREAAKAIEENVASDDAEGVPACSRRSNEERVTPPDQSSYTRALRQECQPSSPDQTGVRRICQEEITELISTFLQCAIMDPLRESEAFL